MPDKSLKQRFSEWYHADEWWRSEPAIVVKFLGFGVKWGLVGYIVMLAIAPHIEFPVTTGLIAINSKYSIVLAILIAAGKIHYCDSTMNEDEL